MYDYEYNLDSRADRAAFFGALSLLCHIAVVVGACVDVANRFKVHSAALYIQQVEHFANVTAENPNAGCMENFDTCWWQNCTIPDDAYPGRRGPCQELVEKYRDGSSHFPDYVWQDSSRQGILTRPDELYSQDQNRYKVGQMLANIFAIFAIFLFKQCCSSGKKTGHHLGQHVISGILQLHLLLIIAQFLVASIAGALTSLKSNPDNSDVYKALCLGCVAKDDAQWKNNSILPGDLSTGELMYVWAGIVSIMLLLHHLVLMPCLGTDYYKHAADSLGSLKSRCFSFCFNRGAAGAPLLAAAQNNEEPQDDGYSESGF